MKVNGSGSGLPPVDIGAGEIDASSKARGAGATEALGGTSASEAAQDSQLVGARGGPQAGRASEMTAMVSDLGAEVQAGRLSADAAVETLVDRILDRQLGQDASPALRQQVEGALRAMLAEDPFVAAHLSALRRAEG